DRAGEGSPGQSRQRTDPETISHAKQGKPAHPGHSGQPPIWPFRAGQESRSTGPRGATSLITMDDITIHATFLPHDDPDASLAFYRDILGFEVRNDVGYGGLRWITVGPSGQPGTSIVLQPPAPPGCGATDDERRTIAELMAKGSYACITLATKDLDGTFERLEASGAEVV